MGFAGPHSVYSNLTSGGVCPSEATKSDITSEIANNHEGK